MEVAHPHPRSALTFINAYKFAQGVPDGRPRTYSREMDPEDPKTPHLEEAMREVVRLLLPLPSYVPLPNGHQTFVPFPPTDGSRSQRETFALVTLRHVHESRHLLSENSFREAIKVAQEAGLMDRPGDVVENSEEQIDHWTTVADVITPRLSGDESAVLDSVAPEDRRPREDALMRALEATQQVVRACILTHQVPVVLPTYERLPTLLLGWSGIAPLHDPQWAPAAALTGMSHMQCT